MLLRWKSSFSDICHRISTSGVTNQLTMNGLVNHFARTQVSDIASWPNRQEGTSAFLKFQEHFAHTRKGSSVELRRMSMHVRLAPKRKREETISFYWMIVTIHRTDSFRHWWRHSLLCRSWQVRKDIAIAVQLRLNAWHDNPNEIVFVLSKLQKDRQRMINGQALIVVAIGRDFFQPPCDAFLDKTGSHSAFCPDTDADRCPPKRRERPIVALPLSLIISGQSRMGSAISCPVFSWRPCNFNLNDPAVEALRGASSSGPDWPSTTLQDQCYARKAAVPARAIVRPKVHTPASPAGFWSSDFKLLYL
jgi:hypothetical protein